MALIVNGTEVENIIVIKKESGEVVELDKFQDENGNIIWEKLSAVDVIFYLDCGTGDTRVNVDINFYKNNDGVNTIDWGDGTIEEITEVDTDTYVTHQYPSKSVYEIVISGEGTFKYFGRKSSNTGATSMVTVQYGTSTAFDETALKYVKMGEICKGLATPFGLKTNGTTPYTTDICYTRSGTTFTGGDNIPLCYYNGNMDYFNTMNYQVNHIIYDGGTENNWLGGFKTAKQLLLTTVGSEFDKSQLSNYKFDSLGYISVPASSNITFPETLVNLYQMELKGTGSTLRFLTPADKKVFLRDGFAYYKTAYTVNIYTDNEDIKNYNWSGDNITPTFYHLDGSAWA